MDKINLFTILKDINFGKSFALHKKPEFNKSFDDFMINRFLSMNPETVFEANFMNRNYSLPKHVKYLFLSDVLEKKNRFLKYIKADREKEDTKMIGYIRDIYRVNKDVAVMMMKTISDDEKKMLKQVFTQKTIRKR